MASGFKNKSSKPCTEFQRNGTCKYGDKCTFSHSTGGRGEHDEDYGIKDEAEVLAHVTRIKSRSKKSMGFKKVYKECLKRWPDIRQAQVKSILKDYDLMYKKVVDLPAGYSVGDIVESRVVFGTVKVGDQGTIVGACTKEESEDDYSERVKINFASTTLNLLVNSQVVKVTANASFVAAPNAYAATSAAGYATSAPYQNSYASTAAYAGHNRGTKRAAPWQSAPARSAPRPVQPPPEVYIQVFDPNSGSNYFYNQATGITSWTRPPGAIVRIQPR